MAILTTLAVPGLSAAGNRELARRITEATAAAPGFLGHAGYPGADGSWQIAEIWDDPAAQARVFADHVRPLLPDWCLPEVQPLHRAIGAAAPGTTTGAVLTMTVVADMDADRCDRTIVPLTGELPTTPGFRGHSAFAGPGGTWVLAETWDTEEQRRAWFDTRLAPILPAGAQTQVIDVPHVFWPKPGSCAPRGGTQ